MPERNTGKKRRSPLGRLWHFVSDGVWDVEVRSLSAKRRYGVSFLRVIHLVFRGYQDDECSLHASALTFNTLMSIVPVLAISLSIAKGFGAGDMVQTKIRDVIHEQLVQFETVDLLGVGQASPAEAAEGAVAHVEGDEADGQQHEGVLPQPGMDAGTNIQAVVVDPGVTNAVSAAGVPHEGALAESASMAAETMNEPEQEPDIVAEIDSIVEQIFSYVERINFAALGGLGLGLLVWTVVSVLGRVESSFNRVFGVVTQRGMLRKFTDYLGVLILAPFLIILSSSLPVIDIMTRFMPWGLGDSVSHLLETEALKHIMVIGFVSLSFALFIMIMPNTKVRFIPALWGGVLSALLFLGWLWVCVQLEVGAVRAGTIYGSFAMVPILLLWVLVSWQIVLLGAEIAFAVQNCTTYRLEKTARNASAESRIILALSIVAEATQAMKKSSGPFDTHDFAYRNNVPVRLLNTVLRELSEAGLIAEIAGGEGLYALLRAPEDIRKRDVIEAIMTSGADPDLLGLDRLKAASEKLLPEA